MFNLFGTRGQGKALPFLTDMHSHFLPGVDDGAPDVETSKRLIGAMRALGYKQLITTPHIYRELFFNTPLTLQPAYEALMTSLREAGMDMPVRYAAEYFLDDYVDELLKQKTPLLPIHDNWVLVETSFVQPPLDLDRRLFDLQLSGYKPILAHPERYPYWHEDKRKFHEIREKGLMLQLNLLSLTGYYGRQVAEAAKYLVGEELVDLVGTDCHHDRHIGALQKGADTILKELDPLIRKDKLLNASL